MAKQATAKVVPNSMGTGASAPPDGIFFVDGLPTRGPFTTETPKSFGEKVLGNGSAPKRVKGPSGKVPVVQDPLQLALTPQVKDELQRTANLFGSALMKFPGVESVGIGFKVSKKEVTSEPAIIVVVDIKRGGMTDIKDVDFIPKKLGKFATDVVASPVNRGANFVCGQPGVYTNNPRVSGKGTMGAIVFVDGIPCGISNQHVWGDKIEDIIHFPSKNSGPRDGVLFRKSNRFDACIAMLEGDTFDTRIELEAGKPGITVERSNEAVIGEIVWKAGATTGATIGKVSAKIPYIFNNNANYYYRVDPVPGLTTGQVSDAGDSGSVVINQAGEAVGLLFGGDIQNVDNYAFYPMPAIQSELQFHW